MSLALDSKQSSPRLWLCSKRRWIWLVWPDDRSTKPTSTRCQCTMATMAIFSLRTQTFGGSRIGTFQLLCHIGAPQRPKCSRMCRCDPLQIVLFDASLTCCLHAHQNIVINSMTLSATCIFTILLNSGFAVDLCCWIQNVSCSAVSF
jgi:hypothetical protein